MEKLTLDRASGKAKAKGEAAERKFVREEEHRSRERHSENVASAELLNWISTVTGQRQLFLRVELTFKMRRKSALGKRMRQPPLAPTVHYAATLDTVDAMNRWTISRVDDGTVNVHVKQVNKRMSLKTAALLATDYYLPQQEPARVAVSVVNFLNRRFFKGRARRTHYPERLTMLACLHDLDEQGNKCRPHLHCIVALPMNISIPAFVSVLREALKREPFVNRRMCVEPVEDLRKSVFYNAEPSKSTTRSPVIYVYPPTKELHK